MTRSPRPDTFLAATLSAAVVGAALLVAAADTHGQEARRGVKSVRSFLELRHEQVVLQRFDISCGAAALATVLGEQHADPVPEREIARSMLDHTEAEQVRARLGFSLLDLKRYVERRGYQGVGYGALTIADLERLGPAILPVRLTVYDHFVVFRGRHGDRVLLADPAFGNRTMPVWEFRTVWRQRIAFFVASRDGQAPPDRLSGERDDFVYPRAAAIRAALD